MYRMWTDQQEDTYCGRRRDKSEPVSLDGPATVRWPLLLWRIAHQLQVCPHCVTLRQGVSCSFTGQ
jgi:hypothetical protein